MSDTVKLIIEIPKDRYTDILRIADVQIVRRMPTLEQVVAHGIPLDDVKAEIEASMYCDKDTRLVKNANASGLEKAIEILDTIGKAESEDK